MRINILRNYQSHFKGQLGFHKAKAEEREKAFPQNVDYLSISSERIESIIGFTPYQKDTYNEKNNKKGKEQYNTVIKMISGDKFTVTAAAEEVAKAKQSADSRSLFVEL